MTSRLRLWNKNTGECLAVLEEHTDWVRGAQFLADGRVLSWSDDATLRLWDVERQRVVAIFQGHTKRLRGCDTATRWSCDVVVKGQYPAPVGC